MERLALVGRLSIDLDGAWDELDVRNVALVRLIDVRQDQVVHLLCVGLALFVLLIATIGISSSCVGFLLFSALRDFVL